MTLPEIGVVGGLVVNAVLVGVTYGSLKARVDAMARKLDNGISAKVDELRDTVTVLESTCKARREMGQC